MELENIKTQTTWNEAAGSINNNNQKINNEIVKLQNATYKNRGYYASYDELVASVPSASNGAIAYVGTQYPFAIYKWSGDSGAWLDSGATGGGEDVTLGNYYTKEETDAMIDDYHVVVTSSEYEALPEKEDKFYFVVEEE